MAETKKTETPEVKKAAPKKKKIIQAAPSSTEERPQATEARPLGNSKAYRAGAVILWVLAFAFEVLAVLTFMRKLLYAADPEPNKRLIFTIVFLVADLICVIVGSLLWKHANRISPASEKNKLKFWLWNNLGVIVTAFAFIPFVILALTNKEADKKTKTIATIVAIVALLIGGAVSYDYDPVSKEDLAAAENVITSDVFWTESGKKYHTHDDCQALTNSETLYTGSVNQAFEAKRHGLCAFCAKKDNIEIDENGSVVRINGASEDKTGVTETAEDEEEDEAAS